MPVLSRFYGIVIRMYFQQAEHNPPHIHVEYGDYRASYGIGDGFRMAGELPLAQERLVLAWMEIHREELMADWKLSEQREELFRIDPLR